jgi:hypothetical protein
LGPLNFEVDKINNKKVPRETPVKSGYYSHRIDLEDITESNRDLNDLDTPDPSQKVRTFF